MEHIKYTLFEHINAPNFETDKNDGGVDDKVRETANYPVDRWRKAVGLAHPSESHCGKNDRNQHEEDTDYDRWDEG